MYAVRIQEDGNNNILILAGSGDDSGSFIKLSKDVLEGKNESTTIETPDKLYKDHNESVSAVRLPLSAQLLSRIYLILSIP